MVLKNTLVTRLTEASKADVEVLIKKDHFAQITLSFWQRLQLRVLGEVFLRHEKRDGWKAYIPVFVIHCPTHKILFLDIRHGSGRFDCPLCREEFVHKVREMMKIEAKQRQCAT